MKLTDNEVNNAKLQKYRKCVDENYGEPVDRKFAGPGEDDDDKDIEHENGQ